MVRHERITVNSILLSVYRIFILEGMLTVIVAIIAFFVLVDYPETATFLTVEERAFVTYRLRYDGQDADTPDHQRVAQSDHFDWKYVRAAFSDWQIWVNIVVYWGYVCPLYGISLFLPTIIRELGYKTTTAQLLTVPIYITASIITVAVAFVADRKHIRSPFVFVGLILQAVGFIMCISTSSPGVTYAGIFIAACALYQCQPSNITWLSNNLAGSYKRAVGMGLQISVGNLAGAVSTFYLTTLRIRLTETEDGVELLSSSRRTSLQTRPWAGNRLHLHGPSRSSDSGHQLSAHQCQKRSTDSCWRA